MKGLICIASQIVLLAAFSRVSAQEPTPCYVRNQNPFVRIFGLPGAESGRTVESRRTECRILFNLASNYTTDENSRESILIDGESYETTLILRHGLTQRLEVGLDVPFIAHNGGFLDGVIDGWHDLFGFSDGGRDEAREDELTYRYTRDGRRRVAMSTARGGLGDVRLSGGYRFLGERDPRERCLALRAGLKLPAGSASKLHGSGSTDLSLSLAATDGKTLGKWGATLFGSAGALFLTDGDVLPERQRDVVGFGSFGIASGPIGRFTLKAQVDAHSALYDSDLTQLGSTALQLTFGTSIALPGKTSLDIGVTEDAAVDTASDVVFQIGLTKGF